MYSTIRKNPGKRRLIKICVSNLITFDPFIMLSELNIKKIKAANARLCNAPYIQKILLFFIDLIWNKVLNFFQLIEVLWKMTALKWEIYYICTMKSSPN